MFYRYTADFDIGVKLQVGSDCVMSWCVREQVILTYLSFRYVIIFLSLFIGNSKFIRLTVSKRYPGLSLVSSTIYCCDCDCVVATALTLALTPNFVALDVAIYSPGLGLDLSRFLCFGEAVHNSYYWHLEYSSCKSEDLRRCKSLSVALAL